uniref:SUMO-activating enzyme subunit 1 n=1 Tax=Plectus sambesii TaxID=2011161 RepID=A0A914WGT4_9BILA
MKMVQTEEPTTTTESITEDEAALYDRQIRLWGLEAQNRLRNSSVLLVGLSGAGAEIAKNLMLAGLKSLTLMDHNNVSEGDRDAQFLAPVDTIGQNRAEASRLRTEQLNPMVQVIVDTDALESKDADFFEKFNLVCLVNQAYEQIERVNEICRKFNIKMCAAGVYGWFGYGFSDLLEHEFIDEVKMLAPSNSNEVHVLDGKGDGPEAKKRKVDEEETAMIKHTIDFSSWSDAMNVDWSRKGTLGKAKRSLTPAYFVIRSLLEAQKLGDNATLPEVIGKAWKDEVERCKLDLEEQKCKPEDFMK